ncbi:Uncharacterised protein [Enterobacter hormaechei]|nr:Uncharacterised protein [Enterobacter hormaechei]
MRRLFTAGIVPAIFFIFVLIPGTVKGFFVDILGVGRQYVFARYPVIRFSICMALLTSLLAKR